MTKFVRYEEESGAVYGVLEDGEVLEIEGDLFGRTKRTGKRHALDKVKLLYPIEPPKILAVGLNYRSHLGDRKQPDHPEMFYKPVSCLQHPEAPIVLPRDAQDVHYEGELVAVIGKRVKSASPEEARAAIFGVTAGNDVSDREWQRGAGKDLQWWRAKGSDTFGPLGPVIVTGLDYANLGLETRVNGEVMQKQSTSDLIFDLPAIVSWVTQWVTLVPGDLIYTGTPGHTSRLKSGDVVEVEIEQVGVLRNPVE